MPYRYLEGITLADYAFEAKGSTLEEMFQSAAEALMGLMISNPESITPAFFRDFKITSHCTSPIPAAEDLLYLFLERLIHIKDADNSLVRTKNIQLALTDSGSTLSCQFYGERIAPSKHHLETDVKAVTQHHFKIQHTENGWFATVIVDV